MKNPPLPPLPPPLKGKYTPVALLPRQGAEAHVLRVRDAARTDLVLKLYHFQVQAQREVWEKLGLLHHPTLMPILCHGRTQDDRDYEIMPYVPGGTVADLLREGTVRSERIRELVNQLASGINCLHAADIIHRDLKPENLLLQADRRHVVIADFGISRLDERLRGTRSMTYEYAPPEAHRGEVSKAWDWWSLGMIVRELVTGVPPFAGMTDHQLWRAVTQQDIDLRQMPTGPLRDLCQGLLRRDPSQRWGGRQVLTWLDRGDGTAATYAPPVTKIDPKPAAAPSKPSGSSAAPAATGAAAKAKAASKVFSLGGKDHRTGPELARTLRELGPDAAGKLFSATARAGQLQRRWQEFLDWTAQLPDEPAGRADTRNVLITRRLVGDRPAEVKLLYLLRWLDPQGPVTHRGLKITQSVITSACVSLATGGGGRESETLVQELVEEQLLHVLTGFTSLKGLKGVWEAQGELAGRWRTSVNSRSTVPERLRDPKSTAVQAALLLAALPGADAQNKLARAAAARDLPSGANVEWFHGLVKDMGGKDSPGGRAARVVGTELAAREWRQREAKKLAKVQQTAAQNTTAQKATAQKATAANGPAAKTVTANTAKAKTKPPAPKQTAGATAQQKAGGAAAGALAAVRSWFTRRRPTEQQLAARTRAAQWTGIWTGLWIAGVWLGWGWGMGAVHTAIVVSTQIMLLMVVPLCFRWRLADQLGNAYRPPLTRPRYWLYQPRPSPWGPRHRLWFAVVFAVASGLLVEGQPLARAKGEANPFWIADAVLCVGALVVLLWRDRKGLRPWDNRRELWRHHHRRR